MFRDAFGSFVIGSLIIVRSEKTEMAQLGLGSWGDDTGFTKPQRPPQETFGGADYGCADAETC